jgi:hypothetical protein
MNAGTCVIPQELYTCNCLSGFEGNNCSTVVPPVTSPSFGQSAAQINLTGISGISDVQLGQVLIALIVLCCIFFLIIIILLIVFIVWIRRVRRERLEYVTIHKGSTSTVGSTLGDSSYESRRFRSVSSVSSNGGDDMTSRRRTAYPPKLSVGSDASPPASPPGYDELSEQGFASAAFAAVNDGESVVNLKV